MTAQRTTPGQPLKSAPCVSRFAPSPTGPLHLGHAYSAITAHDLVRPVGGRFLVRIEDIDTQRSRPEHVEGIFADLAWLGLRWDAVAIQSQRMALYTDALATLRAEGLVYRCSCSRTALQAIASAPHGALPPPYPGTCRLVVVPDDFRGPVAWRLDMAQAVARTGIGEALAHGDVVMARKDAGTSYHLAVVVDDAEQGVTDVVRGRDLLPSTPVHKVLQLLLGLPVPRTHHHALVLGSDGLRLAKRTGSASLAQLRAAGWQGPDLANDIRAGRLPIGFRLDEP